MSWLTPKLRHRVQIQKPSQTALSSGQAQMNYETLLTVWAEKKPISEYIKAVRGVNTGSINRGVNTDLSTHMFTMRKVALQNLGREYSLAFGDGFKNMADINEMKSDYFLFHQKGSTTKGVRYRVVSTSIDDDRNEYVKIKAEEVEEVGTGWA